MNTNNNIYYTEILNIINDGLFILHRNFSIKYISSKAEKFLNPGGVECIGKSIWSIDPSFKNSQMYTNLILATRKSEEVSFDYYHINTEKWFQVRVYTKQEEIIVWFLDITESKRNYITREQHYESLFLNNPDAVYSLDLEGRYLSVNNGLEELTGYTEVELLNHHYSPLVVEEDLEKVKHYFKAAVEGIPQTYYCRAVHKNGDIKHCKVINIPITVENHIIGVYGICKDITLQKVAEQNIEQMDKLSLVGQLSASIAHEIRNPLTTMKGFLQLTKDEKEYNDRYIEIMLKEMNRMELITNELLLLAKPMAVEFKSISINSILVEVVALLQPQAHMKNIEINYVDNELGLIKCVENQLKQTFINLLKNAIEATDNGKEIWVVLTDLNQQHYLVEVIDQGKGISDELAPKIGLPYYSTKEKGTGLGLVTTYKIIHDHGGKIEFTSKMDHGTTFRVYLPKV